jgi:hypothetical protein
MLGEESSEFTPGEWVVVELPGNGNTRVLIQTDDEIIARLIAGRHRTANARLMAMAPVMLLALQMILANPHPFAGPIANDANDPGLTVRYDLYTQAIDFAFSAIEKAVQS